MNFAPVIPRNAYWVPDNACPGVEGPVGMPDLYWSQSIDEWIESHPAFHPTFYNTQGQPADGSFHAIWDEVKNIQEYWARVPAGPHVAKPPIADRARKALRKVVLDCGSIESAVCLGLGQIHWRSRVQYKETWIHQVGFFLAICQLLEQKQGMTPGSIRKVFQDPLFEIEDKYILHRVGGQDIVEMPAANDLMNGNTFVFAPHLNGPAMFDTFLRPGLEPGLLFTNIIHGTLGCLGYAIAVACLTEILLSGDPNANAAADSLFERAERFITSHEGRVFDVDFMPETVTRWAFGSSSFYLPKPKPKAAPSEQQAS